MMGMGLVSPILPQYARSFGVSITMVGLLITVYGVARMIIDIPAGRFAERLGRRPILIAGPLVVAIASVACGLANSYWLLLSFRLIQGMGSAMFTTAAMIMLADISTRDNRGQVMSLYFGSLLLGTSMGPVLGGFIAQYFGFQAPFFVLTFFAITAVLWSYFRLPETRPVSPPQVALASNNKLNSLPATSRKGLKPLLRDLNFLLICTVNFGSFFMRNGAQNQILPLLESDRLGLGTGQIGVTLTIISILNFPSLFVVGKLSDRFGRKTVITPGSLMAVAALVMLSQTYSYWFLILTCVIWGIGTGISGPIPAAYVADIIPRENYSSGMGLYRAISDLGFVIGPILMGWLADTRGFSFSLLFNAVFLFLATLIFQIFAKEHPDANGRGLASS